MQNTVDHNFVFFNLEQYPILATPHPIFRGVICEFYHVTLQTVFEQINTSQDSFPFLQRDRSQVLDRLWFEFRGVIHSFAYRESLMRWSARSTGWSCMECR